MRRLPLLSLCFVFSNNHFIQSSVASTSLDSCCICNRIFIVFNSLQPSTFTQVSPTASLQDLWNGISINFILIATHRSTDQHNTSLYKPSRPRLKHKNRANNRNKRRMRRRKEILTWRWITGAAEIIKIGRSEMESKTVSRWRKHGNKKQTRRRTKRVQWRHDLRRRWNRKS